MFFAGLRSERQLLDMAANRLSVRWYLGYDLDEPLPEHSSLTRIRDRYGREIFRRFFDVIVAQYERAGLVWGRERYFDATETAANAATVSLAPRFAVEAHLSARFAGPDAAPLTAASAAIRESTEPLPLPHAGGAAYDEEVAEANRRRHDWFAEAGRQNRAVRRKHYERWADYQASRTDPDASLTRSAGGPRDLGYHVHYAVDGGRGRTIRAVLVTPSEVMENQPMLDLLWHTCFRLKVIPAQVTGDTTYGTIENIMAIEEAGIRADVALPNDDQRTRYFSVRQFSYDAARDVYVVIEAGCGAVGDRELFTGGIEQRGVV